MSHLTDRRYREIAIYISNQILKLKGRVLGFNSISRVENVYLKSFPFRPIIDYRYRVIRYEPVPDAEPSTERPIYDADGFSLFVWMVKGDLGYLKRDEPPVEIGEYKIVVDVAGPQQNRVKPIIDKIVLEAARHFNQTTQSNNSLQRSANRVSFICEAMLVVEVRRAR